VQTRPKKECYSPEKIAILRKKAIENVLSIFLPDEKIIRIYLIGSSVKNNFGKYEQPGFRGSLYSDFDFIVFVEDTYEIPKLLRREPTGKPFSKDEMNLAYRNKNFVDNTYDVEIFFIRRKNMYDKKIKEEGELAGIPMTPESKNKHMLIYSKKGMMELFT
jgi:predicted nucleotidyltransferase